jgi:hypothetical protein
MTLTEFLLARITEDEAYARYCDEGTVEGITYPIGGLTQILAECEAKRRIVEDFEDYASEYRKAPSDFAAGRRHAALLAATRIAAIYADHEDYDEEWKP